jgi:stage II sporulation protein D
MSTRRVMVLVALGVLGGLAASKADEGQTIRVGLHYGPTAPKVVKVSGTGRWEAQRARGALAGEAQTTAREGQLVLRIDGRQGGVGSWVELWPTGDDPWLVMDGKAYRGRLRLELQPGDGVKVVNRLGLEDYVRGVVPNEMFADGDAYKVQAVISRTYAMYVRDLEKKHAREGFDICSTGHCQVYRGVDSERPTSDAAVEATRGQVLTYEGRVIFSAYHSNAGGETETVDQAWPGSVRRYFPYLCRVESPYDREARALGGFEWCWEWERTVRSEQVRERLAAQGRDVGEVCDLIVGDRTPAGRVKELEVVGRRGRVRVSGPGPVERLLGVPSAKAEISREGDDFRVSGVGYGHGVGLSQHGALGMARASYDYVDILGHYYRGVALTEDYGGGASRALSPPELRR